MKLKDWRVKMLSRGSIRGPRVGVRARLLAIVLVPSLTLLGIGVGAASYLVIGQRDVRDWAELVSGTTGPAIRMVQAFQEERRLSLRHLAGDDAATAQLGTARQRSDEARIAVQARGRAAAELHAHVETNIQDYDALYAKLPELRAAIDARALTWQPVYAAFSAVVDIITSASMIAARDAPTADVAVELEKGIEVLRAAEALSRTGAVVSVAGDLDPERFSAFVASVGETRSEINYAATLLNGVRLAQLNDITGGETWQRLTTTLETMVRRGPDEPDTGTVSRAGAPSSAATDRSEESAEISLAVLDVGPKLLRLWEDQSRDAHAAASANANRVAKNSWLGGAAVFATAVLGYLAVLVLANQLIRRMYRLRAATLDLVDQQLPAAMTRAGADGDPQAPVELARLNFGSDEIGQVADAFNRAHAAAVAAAVAEARMRAGVSTVLVNIAQRSQVIVHRQLELLDSAERGEEDPKQLQLLFRLDHLATRARRHAENLIIIGGARPGRRWRQAVPLIDIVRSAISESVDYQRVDVHRQSDVQVAGVVVGDLIHLLAELIDNATAFSPPECHVDVFGSSVGKGVVVQIVDRGLGLTDDQLGAHNSALAQPPGFDLDTLVGDPRLGLFVVATLAVRHGISIRLSESEYGGIRAIVLIPTRLLVAGAGTTDMKSTSGALVVDPGSA